MMVLNHTSERRHSLQTMPFQASPQMGLHASSLSDPEGVTRTLDDSLKIEGQNKRKESSMTYLLVLVG